MTLTLRFPEGPSGDAARALSARAAQYALGRTANVARTVINDSAIELKVIN